MSRLATLEARRRELLNRCEEQRIELAYRAAQFRPGAQLTAWRRRGSAQAASHPIALVIGAATLLMMFRSRKMLGNVTRITGLVALASRATALLRILAQLRALYLNFKGTRRTPT